MHPESKPYGRTATAFRIAFVIAVVFGMLLLPGCSSEKASDAWSAIRGGVEAARGAPSESALRERKTFNNGGIKFDYPAPLTLSHEHSEGDDTWVLEYGLYSIELYVTTATGTAAQDYLEGLGSVYGSGGSTAVTQAPRAGRTLSLCGQPAQASVMRVKLLGDESVYEAFDLPSDAQGRARLLIVSDEPVNAQPSAIAAASENMLLETLRCAAAAPGSGTSSHQEKSQ